MDCARQKTEHMDWMTQIGSINCLGIINNNNEVMLVDQTGDGLIK